MSEMSYLGKLLDGVEVEWKAVGDIAGYSTTKVDADKLDATSFVGVDNLLADKGGRIDATYQPNTARLTAYEPGDILLGNIRPYLKKVWMAENNGGCSGDVLAIRILADCKKIISPEYLYYALSSDSFFSYSMQHAKGAKMPRGSKDAILNYQIPIPCPSAPGKSLAIQSEIVRILDKFTALTAELTAELTARKKQYNYYRDQLLSFDEEQEKPIYLEKLLDGVKVEWKMLGEVIHSLKTGLNPRQNFSLNTLDAQGYYVTVREIQNGKVVFLDKTDRVNDRALKIINGRSNLEAGDILFSGTGTVGRIAVIEENPINWNIKEGVYTIKPIKEKIAPRFLSYLLQSSKIVKDYSKKIVGNPVISLPMGDLKKLLIPIPCPGNPEKSLAIQSEIVRILDKFDTLTNSITEGLPREIELRQKQYEYYRDLLFSFPKPDSVTN